MSRAMRPWLAIRALALLVVGAESCQNVLDLEEPHPRPEPEAGAAGMGDTSGGASGSSQGGSAGTGRGGTAEGGAPDAGSAGDGVVGGGGAGAVGGNTGGGGRGGDTGGEAGEAGAGGGPECVFHARRCGGADLRTPEICDGDGSWIVNDAENEGGPCPAFCALGECVECLSDTKRCNGPIRQDCEDGAWVNRELCDDFCRKGDCENAPSCRGTLDCTNATSCCRALDVPSGEFKRDFDGDYYADDSFSATLDAFLLDKFEVTVGRWRNFVGAYDEIERAEGDGRAPQIAEDPGWHNDYTMPADETELRARLNDSVACPDATWTDAPGINEQRPMNCVDFPTAYAFCIWDGGRLPTEAEWNYAAAGGSEQRKYPWQAPFEEKPPADRYAFFDQPGGLPDDVGRRGDGDGRWGHSDLAGNVLEWTLDYKGDYPTSCVNCLNTRPEEFRAVRGSAYLSPEEALVVAVRVWERDTYDRDRTLGFRCVHDLQ